MRRPVDVNKKLPIFIFFFASLVEPSAGRGGSVKGARSGRVPKGLQTLDGFSAPCYVLALAKQRKNIFASRLHLENDLLEAGSS
jgi:hypothetical protein